MKSMDALHIVDHERSDEFGIASMVDSLDPPLVDQPMESTGFSLSLRQLLADKDILRYRQEERSALSPSMSFGRHFGPPLPTARAAAVMLLVEIDAEQSWNNWTIPLTVRPNHLPSHAGQISLPGGRVEAGETIEAAARRELYEELGLAGPTLTTLGPMLSLYVYNSDYFVTPFVAVDQRQSTYHPCPDEVERVIHLPLGILMDDANYRCEHFTRGLLKWQAPVLVYGDEQIWGATAIVLGEFRGLLRRLVDRGELKSTIDEPSC